MNKENWKKFDLIDESRHYLDKAHDSLKEILRLMRVLGGQISDLEERNQSLLETEDEWVKAQLVRLNDFEVWLDQNKESIKLMLKKIEPIAEAYKERWEYLHDWDDE